MSRSYNQQQNTRATHSTFTTVTAWRQGRSTTQTKLSLWSWWSKTTTNRLPLYLHILFYRMLSSTAASLQTCITATTLYTRICTACYGVTLTVTGACNLVVFVAAGLNW